MSEETSNKPRSVELINEKEHAIKYYQAFLDRLAQGDTISSEIFTNRGEAHASILMATLLANTTKKLKLYCRGLSPGILCGKTEGDGNGFEGAYWNEFKSFFKDRKKYESIQVEILIQNTKWLYNMPFNIISEAIKTSKIQVKKIKDDSKKRIESLLGNANGENYNFAIFDEKAFRLEYNPNNYQAMGSFHNPSWCRLLTYLFDEAFQKADPIKKDEKSPFYIQNSKGNLYIDCSGHSNIEEEKATDDQESSFVLKQEDKKIPVQIDENGNLSVHNGEVGQIPAYQDDKYRLLVKGLSNIEISVNDNRIEFRHVQNEDTVIPVQIRKNNDGNLSIFVLIDGNEQPTLAYQDNDGRLYVGYDKEKKEVIKRSDGSLSLLSVQSSTQQS